MCTCWRIRILRNNETQSRVTFTRRQGTNFTPFIPFSSGRSSGTISIAIFVAFLTIFAKYSNCATQFASFAALEEDCVKHNDSSSHCKITKQTILTLTPSNHLSQLLIKRSDGLPMGSIDIVVDDIAVECQKSSEFFSRSHEVLVHSSKRCPKQGSCVGNACANTKFDSQIPELESANNYPGNSYCIDSCSFLMCGCALPTTSCIFFRTHAVERSKKIFEFFSHARHGNFLLT